MINNYTIITIPQWAIFAAITVIIYGWVEKKKAFGLLGSAIMIGLSLFAIWTIRSGALIPEGFFDTSDYADGEQLFLPDELPMEGRMLPFYWGLALNGILAIAALITDIKNLRLNKILKVVMCLVGFLIFFGMIGAARM